MFPKQTIGRIRPQPHDLIDTARGLLRHNNGRPRQADLRRALSTLCYALFDCLARDAADTLIGGKKADRSQPAWTQVYRSLEHGTVTHKCSQDSRLRQFPSDIQDFAALFVSMQEKRPKADYDPEGQFYKSGVELDLGGCAEAFAQFGSAHKKDRRAFAAFILLKNR